MSFVKINEHDIFYEVYGEGDTVILLHNGFSCSKMWGKIAPILEAAGFRVLVYDRRGYGQSDGGADFEAHYVGNGFRDAAVTTLAYLVDHLGFDTFHILGSAKAGWSGSTMLCDTLIKSRPWRLPALSVSATLPWKPSTV